MKITYDEFMLRFLRPAVFKGEELELSVEFENTTLYMVDAETAKAINTAVGDTVRAFVCANFEENNSKNFTLYLTGDELTNFINIYGIKNINDTVSMRLKHVYSVVEKADYSSEKYKEIVGFQLLNIM